MTVTKKRATETRAKSTSAESASLPLSTDKRRLHRCSFVPYQPSPVQQVAFSPEGTLPLAAVLRGTQPPSIEIYNPQNDWCIERTIAGRHGENYECLAWIGPSAAVDAEMDSDTDAEEGQTRSLSESLPEFKRSKMVPSSKNLCPLKDLTSFPRARLISAGIDGRLREWNVKDGGLEEVSHVDVNGGAIWSLAVSPDQGQLAVGSEDGRIRVFAILSTGFEFLRGFESSKDGRVLSMCWSLDGGLLVSGSAEGILQVWNPQSGRSVHAVRADRVSPHCPTAIWCVAAVSGEMVASGDSTGHVRFWDLTSGCQVQAFHSFGGDILTVAATNDGSRLFASGVDSKHVHYSLVDCQNIAGVTVPKWVEAGSKRMHTHDVRSLAVGRIFSSTRNECTVQEVVLSGGLDCGLVLFDSDKFRGDASLLDMSSISRFLPPYPRLPGLVQIQEDGRIAALLPDKNSIQIWALGAEKVANVAAVALSRRDAICSFVMHGDLLAVLTRDELRLFRVVLAEDGSSATVQPIEFSASLPVSRYASFPHMCAFSPDGKSLLLCSSQQMFVLDVSDTVQLAAVHAFAPSGSKYFNMLAVSARLAVLSSPSSNTVVAVDWKAGAVVGEVNSLDFPVSAMKFSAESVLVAVTVSNELCRVDLSKPKALAVEVIGTVPKKQRNPKDPFIGIVTSSERISLFSTEGVAQFPVGKKRAASRTGTDDGSAARFISEYKPLLGFGVLKSGDAVVVERPWADVVAQLPQSFYRPRYGAQ